MNIKKIESFLFNPNASKNLLFCRVETSNGIYGWGEAYVGKGKEKVVQNYIQAMAPSLIGLSVFDIRHNGSALFDDFQIRRSAVDYFSAWSSIEIALWDIVGKITGQPVYNLLGGRCREAVRVYANGWWFGVKTIDETVERAIRMKEKGFSALKWDPFFGPWRNYITQPEEDIAVENVRAMREELGPEMDLMIEVHRRLSPYHAIHFAKRIEQYNPFVFEEPCLSDNIDLVAQVKKEVPSMRIVTGETCYTKSEFKNILESHAADVINPDICICNGILGMTELAAMVEPYNVCFSPHNYNSTIVGLAATVHVSCMAPSFNIAELFVNLKEGCDMIDKKPLTIKNGFVELPTDPGLGIDINVDELLKHPGREFPPTVLTSINMEYPRK
jgi:galactonate dehydratase